MDFRRLDPNDVEDLRDYAKSVGNLFLDFDRSHMPPAVDRLKEAIQEALPEGYEGELILSDKDYNRGDLTNADDNYFNKAQAAPQDFHPRQNGPSIQSRQASPGGDYKVWISGRNKSQQSKDRFFGTGQTKVRVQTSAFGSTRPTVVTVERHAARSGDMGPGGWRGEGKLPADARYDKGYRQQTGKDTITA